VLRVVETRATAGEAEVFDAGKNRLANDIGDRVDRAIGDARSQLLHATVVVVSFVTTRVVDVVVDLVHVASILR